MNKICLIYKKIKLYFKVYQCNVYYKIWTYVLSVILITNATNIKLLIVLMIIKELVLLYVNKRNNIRITKTNLKCLSLNWYYFSLSFFFLFSLPYIRKKKQSITPFLRSFFKLKWKKGIILFNFLTKQTKDIRFQKSWIQIIMDLFSKNDI